MLAGSQTFELSWPREQGRAEALRFVASQPVELSQHAESGLHAGVTLELADAL